MKKKVLAFIIALSLIISSSIVTYAADGFNKAVFDNAQDVFVSRDDMNGDLVAITESLLSSKGTVFPEIGGGYVRVYSGVTISDDANLNAIVFRYYADSWAFVDSVIIKIGNKRYKFDNLHISHDVLKDATIVEDIGIDMTSDVLPMMADLIAHRDEEIKVRLQGSNRDIDFILTDDIKNSVKYSLQGTTQGRYLTGGVPPVGFSM